MLVRTCEAAQIAPVLSLAWVPEASEVLPLLAACRAALPLACACPSSPATAASCPVSSRQERKRVRDKRRQGLGAYAVYNMQAVKGGTNSDKGHQQHGHVFACVMQPLRSHHPLPFSTSPPKRSKPQDSETAHLHSRHSRHSRRSWHSWHARHARHSHAHSGHHAGSETGVHG